MAERLRPITTREAALGLTPPMRTPRLEGGAIASHAIDIFMAEPGGGETQKPVTPPREQQHPQGVDAAQVRGTISLIQALEAGGVKPQDILRQWESLIQEDPTQARSAAEAAVAHQRNQRLAPVETFNRAAPPPEAVEINPASFTDAHVHEIAEDVVAAGMDNTDYLREAIRRIDNNLDMPVGTGLVMNRTEARELKQQLQGQLRMLERQIREARAEEGRRNRRVDEKLEKGLENLRGENGNTDLRAMLVDPTRTIDLREKPGSANPLDRQVNELLRFMREDINPADRSGSYTEFARAILEDEAITQEAKKVLMEAMLERIIGMPDLTPEGHYNIGSITVQGTKDEILALVESKLPGRDREFIRYLHELSEIRSMAHELNRSFKHGETYKKYILEGLSNTGLDFMQNEVAGVANVIRMYEKVATQKVAEKRTWLSAADEDDIEGTVHELVSKMNADGLLEKLPTHNDNSAEGPAVHGRPLTDWELQRALRLGRILFAGTQRYAMYAVMGDLPQGVVTTERIGSIPFEYVARALTPLKIFPARFNLDQGQQALMRKFMEVIDHLHHVKEGGGHHGHPVELFGINDNTWKFNSFGASDLESHGWRSQKLFLANIGVDIPHSEEMQKLAHQAGVVLNADTTLTDFLNLMAQKHAVEAAKEKGQQVEIADPLAGMNGTEKDALSTDEMVRNVVLGQTLYLSVLSRYDNFNNALKADIWRKIAILKPSTVAALLPHDVRDKAINGQTEVWKSLQKKMLIAEELRVQSETRRYENREMADMNRLSEEAKAFTDIGEEGRGNDAAKYQLERYFTGDNALSGAEGAMLRRLIDLGYANAGKIPEGKMPYTFAIDDAPRISWSQERGGKRGIAQADMLRLIYSDQTALAESLGGITNIIESPIDPKWTDNFILAVDKWATVHGRESAQDKFEPFLIAYMEMASMKLDQEIIPGKYALSRLFRKPTSEMEQYYRSSFLSLNAEEKAAIVHSLVQLKALADNPNKRDKFGRTQMDRVAKMTHSDRVMRLIFGMWLMAQILGPAFAYEVYKNIVPSVGGSGGGGGPSH